MTLATLHHTLNAGNIIVGALLAALVFLFVDWVGRLISFPNARAVAAILAVLVFISYAFGGF